MKNKTTMKIICGLVAAVGFSFLPASARAQSYCSGLDYTEGYYCSGMVAWAQASDWADFANWIESYGVCTNPAESWCSGLAANFCAGSPTGAQGTACNDLSAGGFPAPGAGPAAPRTGLFSQYVDALTLTGDITVVGYILVLILVLYLMIRLTARVLKPARS